MRAALLLLLALAVAPSRRYREEERRTPPVGPPLLQVLPTGNSTALGAGTLTGSRGEVLTVTRASTKTCTKANGALATLTSGQPCVETAGLLVEGAATNLSLQSEALGSSMSKFGSPAATPTIANNSADVSDIYGTGNTEEKVTFGATTGTNQYNFISETVTITAGTYTWSARVRTLSGTASTYLFLTDGSSLKTAQLCSLSAAYTRCSVTATFTGTTAVAAIGVHRNVTGGYSAAMADLPAQTLYVEGTQLESGSVATSYIATTTTATTRAADVVAAGSYTLGPRPSLGVTATLSALPTDATLLQPYNSSDASLLQLLVKASDSKVYCNGGSTGAVSSGTISLGVSFRASCTYDGASYRVCLNGTCSSTAGTAPAATTFAALNIGNGLTASATNVQGWLTALCFHRRGGTCL